MAFPSAVNDQVTDSVTQANTKVVDQSPALVMGNLMIAASQALGNAASNAVAEQQNATATSNEVVNEGIDTLLAINAATGNVAVDKILHK